MTRWNGATCRRRCCRMSARSTPATSTRRGTSRSIGRARGFDAAPDYTRCPNDRLSGAELGEIPVIARSKGTTQSPARESRCTRRVGDCLVASLLAMTGGTMTGGRYPLAYVNLFGAWYNLLLRVICVILAFWLLDRNHRGIHVDFDPAIRGCLQACDQGCPAVEQRQNLVFLGGGDADHHAGDAEVAIVSQAVQIFLDAEDRDRQ